MLARPPCGGTRRARRGWPTTNGKGPLICTADQFRRCWQSASLGGRVVARSVVVFHSYPLPCFIPHPSSILVFAESVSAVGACVRYRPLTGRFSCPNRPGHSRTKCSCGIYQHPCSAARPPPHHARQRTVPDADERRPALSGQTQALQTALLPAVTSAFRPLPSARRARRVCNPGFCRALRRCAPASLR
jgi:hypothetical protein